MQRHARGATARLATRMDAGPQGDDRCGRRAPSSTRTSSIPAGRGRAHRSRISARSKYAPVACRVASSGLTKSPDASTHLVAGTHAPRRNREASPAMTDRPPPACRTGHAGDPGFHQRVSLPDPPPGEPAPGARRASLALDRDAGAGDRGPGESDPHPGVPGASGEAAFGVDFPCASPSQIIFYMIRLRIPARGHETGAFPDKAHNKMAKTPVNQSVFRRAAA